MVINQYLYRKEACEGYSQGHHTLFMVTVYVYHAFVVYAIIV